jgi:hypothetical protein
MKKFAQFFTVAVLASLLVTGGAFAFSTGVDFGTDITISDENTDADGAGDDRGIYEDGETEPGMEAGQKWDLEGFFLSDDNILTMVGGYDFVNGEQDLFSGDVFLDVDGDAVFGDIHGTYGNHEVQNTNGYDYVLDMDFATFTYDVYQLTDETTTITSKEWKNQGSNPWRYSSGGILLQEDVAFTYQTGLSNADTGFEGGSHNVVGGLDLNFLASDVSVEFISHFTMQCGNDNLMGRAELTATPGGGGGSAAAPEPATMFLLGSGLLGVGTLKRKYAKKK